MLIQSNRNLQTFIPTCESFYASNPTFRMTCALFIDDIIRQVDGELHSYTLKIIFHG